MEIGCIINYTYAPVIPFIEIGRHSKVGVLSNILHFVLHNDIRIKWMVEYYVSNKLALLYTRSLPTFLPAIAEIMFGKCEFLLKEGLSQPASEASYIATRPINILLPSSWKRGGAIAPLASLVPTPMPVIGHFL